MGILDEFKRLAHPYEDEEPEEEFDDFDEPARPAERRSISGPPPSSRSSW